MDQTVHRLVDSLARDSASRLVAALARRLGAGRIATAEDAVQHALMQALSLWPFKGVPERPEAWLSTVARNRALDLMRRESVPADELMGRRMEVGVVAVLGQLRAKRNWYRIMREWVYAEEPATELGEQEWEYFESRGERRTPGIVSRT